MTVVDRVKPVFSTASLLQVSRSETFSNFWTSPNLVHENKTQLISDAMKSSSLIQNGLSVFLQLSPNTKHACLFFLAK